MAKWLEHHPRNQRVQCVVMLTLLQVGPGHLAMSSMGDLGLKVITPILPVRYKPSMGPLRRLAHNS